MLWFLRAPQAVFVRGASLAVIDTAHSGVECKEEGGSESGN